MRPTTKGSSEMDNASSSSLGDRAVDVAGRVEIRGIDYVPAEERHGKARDLFWIWLAANVTYL
ncbi:hypothetical protein [Mycobacterium antarcticum]|uniref:hypothetical protein n=1 Tax=Mycolicibacterium sp. TUM20983 TaxID=3023369 RepID=UPI0024E06461|nr:hypothetical protein [Mycolicibacterium sp. TUM20983]